MPTVNVPGVGQLNFPDGMSQQDMAAAIQKNFPQIHQQAPAAAPDQPLGFVGGMRGVAQMVDSGITNAVGGVVNAGSDLAHRLVGNNNSAPILPHVAPGPEGQQLENDIKNSSIGQGAASVAQALANRFDQNSADFRGDLVRNGLQVMGDFANVSNAAHAANGGTPLEAQESTAAAPVTPLQSAGEKAGYRTAANHPIAAGAAGQSGIDALTLHNQQIGDVRLSGAAGIPAGAQPTQQAFDFGAEAPNAVYNRVAAALPTQALSPDAQTAVQNAGVSDLITHSPDSQAILDAQKARLLGAPGGAAPQLTGDQIIGNMRALRQEGYQRLGSEDVEQQNLGKAQLDMARGLEQHVTDTLPENGDVSLAQFQDARTALAQNYAVRGALVGNHISLPIIARLQRNDPGLLTGELQTAADFANEHPKVTGLANRIEVPPSIGNDMGQALNSARSADVIGRMLGAAGVTAKARSILTGDTAAAVQAARDSVPKSNLARFAPLEPQPPQPPPGMTAGPMGGGTPPAGPQPGVPPGIPLADLLSHGVEQEPPQGLSAGPMGAPPANGLHFQVPPESLGARILHGGPPNSGMPFGLDGEPLADHPDVAGTAPVQLGDRIAQAGPGHENPAVLLQGHVDSTPVGPGTAPTFGPGVPEDIAARAANAPSIYHQADEVTGQHVVTSPNGQSDAQESGAQLIEKRSDTAPSAQGSGEGLARTQALVEQAENRGLKYTSDVSVSPAMQKVYAKLARDPNYKVIRNPNAVINPTTGNLISDDPRKPVFIVRSQLSSALGDLVAP